MGSGSVRGLSAGRRCASLTTTWLVHTRTPRVHTRHSAQPYPEQVPSAYPGALPPPVPYPGNAAASTFPRGRARRTGDRGARCRGHRGRIRAAAPGRERVEHRGADAGFAPRRRFRTSSTRWPRATTRPSPSTRRAVCSTQIKDKQSDMALANLASDAFRRQYGTAEVTSDRQDRDVVAESGSGAVHDAGETDGPHPVRHRAAGRRADPRRGQGNPGVLVPTANR